MIVNYLHNVKNLFLKIKLDLNENYESYQRKFQSVPIILAHTVDPCQNRSKWIILIFSVFLAVPFYSILFLILPIKDFSSLFAHKNSL